MRAWIEADSIGIQFLFDRQARVVTPTLSHFRRKGTDAWGLKNVSFTVSGGESVALLGPSGSGKTSLLRLIAGVFVPDAGRLSVGGRVASLLSIEAGLLPTLTGRENCVLLGVLAGFSRRESKGKVEQIKARSGLGVAFERPIGSYSQGMRARLGYTVAEAVDPDVMLLDEVHEALDHEFRAVVYERATQMLTRGGIVIAAGHDHELLNQICSRALLLDHGSVRADGDFLAVQAEYLSPP
jgi:ABC-type polysaccharide/polyol phosphate transport system ATPase subunit